MRHLHDSQTGGTEPARAWSRREFLRTGAIASLAVTGASVSGPARGSAASPFDEFDREIERFMSARNVPGGALAVVKDGRLVYARAYGWADRENKSPAKPTSLFRIASISKPFTDEQFYSILEHKDEPPEQTPAAAPGPVL